MWSLLSGSSIVLSFTSLIVGVASLVSGTRAKRELKKREDLLREVLSEKKELRDILVKEQERTENLRTDLERRQEEKEKLREEKHRENQRLQNLKRVLREQGIDTSYLVEKYDDSLYAPVMVLTHFSSPNHNNEAGEKLIGENLTALDAKTLHGATKIIPPRDFDQNLRGRKDLKEWFDDEVLGGQDNLSHKLEFLSIVDITQVFDRDSTKQDKVGYPANTVNELFDTDTVVPTEELLNILSQSEKISIEHEIRENIALLAVSSASEEQMEALIENQTEIQNKLGALSQILNTKVERINKVLAENGVPGPEELAKGIQNEAKQLKDILG